MGRLHLYIFKNVAAHVSTFILPDRMGQVLAKGSARASLVMLPFLALEGPQVSSRAIFVGLTSGEAAIAAAGERGLTRCRKSWTRALSLEVRGSLCP